MQSIQKTAGNFQDARIPGRNGTQAGDRNRKRESVAARIAVTGVLMAMNVALSSFGIPVPGGHLYLCDAVICLSAILLGPFEAFAVGGIGSFIGDMLFYPLPMFVSLVTHGLQAAVISLISHRTLKDHPKIASGIGVTVGAVIMVTCYTLGKIYVYSTLEYAILKLPYEITQGALGAVLGMILCWKCGIRALYEKIIAENE